MTYLLVAYIVLFGIGQTALVVFDRTLVPPEERDPPLEAVADVLLVAVLFCGMLFIAFGIESSLVKSIWKPVAVVAAAYGLFSSLHDRAQMLRDPESAEDRSLVPFADAGTLVLLLPAVLLNVYYAFLQ